MSNSPIIVTRDLVKRGWSDFEPKVVAGLLTGSVGAFLIPIAAGFGIHLTAIQANYAVVAFYFLGSYLTPSAGTKVISTQTDANHSVTKTETHSGQSVSVVTASTPIQPQYSRPAAVPRAGVDESGSVYTEEPVPAVDKKDDPFWSGFRSTNPDDNATRVLD